MLGNYLKVALRNLLRQKGYSLINIGGLAIGMAGCILIMLWVLDEVSYDRFHAQADNIYRVVEKNPRPDGPQYSITLPAPIGPGIKDMVPEIVDFMRLGYENLLLEYGDKGFSLQTALIDSTFFRMFSFRLLDGNPQTALTDPYSVVLTAKTAAMVFGDENPLGKTVRVDDQFDVTVTGVMEDPPTQSHLTFTCVVPLALMELAGYDMDNWGDARFWTYIQLRDDAAVATVADKIRHFEQTKWADVKIELELQPLTDIHLHDLNGGGAITYVYILSAIAFMVLAIACINFMNLATARAAKRAREIGLRKVVGANRMQLIRQIMGESIALAIVALMLAVCLVELGLPAFNELAAKHLTLDIAGNLQAALMLLGITLITGVLAGSYPALFLSGFKPVHVLKRTCMAGVETGGSLFRKGLVVFQFVLSIALIIATAIAYQQLDFIKKKDLGLQKDHILCLQMDNLSADYQTVKSELRRNPDIYAATATYSPPAWLSFGTGALDYWDGMQDDEKRFFMGLALADYDYFSTFGMEIIEGRAFSEEFATDATAAYIVNETAVRAMGMQPPIGKEISWNNRPGKIIGVVKDFHFQSLRHEIQPFGILILPDYHYLCLRINPERTAAVISFLEQKWRELRPGQEFTYNFMDTLIDQGYRSEQRLGTIATFFTLLAIFISCLGLFGLSSYTAQQRTKEIGIRKILGAPAVSIVTLLSRGFLLLIGIANFIAWPIAYLTMNRWLENFAYRMEIGLGTFLVAGLAAVLIVLVTVGFQVIKAALANPVDSLRHD